MSKINVLIKFNKVNIQLECVMEIDYRLKLTIFESLLITFETSALF